MALTRTRLTVVSACTVGLAAVVGLASAAPAGACGGLVGENGTIQLVKTTTLAAYHDGVERYVTSFEFTGEGEEVGSIIPLPDVPTKVERGGDWTLQRLAQEVAPPVTEESAFSAAGAADADRAEVILQTQIDALDITILKGGGDEVGTWARDNGFLLTPDAPEVLDYYSERSQIFMAARFDADRAATLGQTAGRRHAHHARRSRPTQPWVPLRILGLGLDGSEVVEADVFLLTDDEPSLLAGGSGLTIDRSEQAAQPLLTTSAPTSGWSGCPTTCGSATCSWKRRPADLDYDLAVSADGGAPALADTGVKAPDVEPVTPDSQRSSWPLAAGLSAGIVAVLVLAAHDHRRRAPKLAGPS